jgi:hypothetical protein
MLALALAGCAGESDQHVWAGVPEPLPPTGTLPVEGFADHAAGLEEPWERSPALVAAEFLRLDEAEAARTTIEVDAGPEAGGPALVTVTLEGLLDDSVRARRFVLDLARDGEAWRLERATWTQRCVPGRGHDAFSPQPCV